jgi:hypothetical protein
MELLSKLIVEGNVPFFIIFIFFFNKLKYIILKKKKKKKKKKKRWKKKYLFRVTFVPQTNAIHSSWYH